MHENSYQYVLWALLTYQFYLTTLDEGSIFSDLQCCDVSGSDSHNTLHALGVNGRKYCNFLQIPLV